jgi:hypothetical protein
VVAAAIELRRFRTIVKVEDENVLPARKRGELEASAGSRPHPPDGNVLRCSSTDRRDHVNELALKRSASIVQTPAHRLLGTTSPHVSSVWVDLGS